MRQRIDIEVTGAIREAEFRRRQIKFVRTSRRLVEEKLQIEREKLRRDLSAKIRLAAFEVVLVAAENHEFDTDFAHLDAFNTLHRALGTRLKRWEVDIEDVGKTSAPDIAAE